MIIKLGKQFLWKFQECMENDIWLKNKTKEETRNEQTKGKCCQFSPGFETQTVS